MWDQADCVGYIKTAAVLAAYVDQSISTNTFYSPRHFPGRKVPATLIAKNLMLAHYYGLKTFYYSLIDKQGSKYSDDTESPEIASSEIAVNGYHVEVDDMEDCEACKL